MQRKFWHLDEVQQLYQKPFMDLIFQAQSIHRENFNPNEIEVNALLSIKTGACPEDCAYCPQSSRYKTGVKREAMLDKEEIIKAAKEAKKRGITRFCMGAAWKNPQDEKIPFLQEVIKEVKDLGLETCMTLGMLSEKQAQDLAAAGLDYYNHNLDSSREFYKEIITTRTYDDRLDTLENVRNAGIKICSGGILGMGEKIKDRLEMLITLANLPKPPESVPINQLIKIKGTPLEDAPNLDSFDFIKVIAIARILMPKSKVRIAAGREFMSEEMQTLCFMAGANSIFYGCKLLTANNNDENKDLALFEKLGINQKWVEKIKNLNIGSVGVYVPVRT